MSHLACVQAGSAPRNKNFAAKRITCLTRMASSRVNDPTGIWIFFVLLHYVPRHAGIDRGQLRYGRTVAQFLQRFMNQETYDQIHVSEDIVGDYAAYLQEGMVVNLSVHEGVPVAIEIPQKVTLEIVDTEPVVKGQTASGSFKPAKLSNGVRTMVPTHITVGTRVVVNTGDGSYVERAKD